MRVLLKDGMVIKEGDEQYIPSVDCEKLINNPYWEVMGDFYIGKIKHYGVFPIRRHLATIEERDAFWEECKECEE